VFLEPFLPSGSFDGHILLAPLLQRGPLLSFFFLGSRLMLLLRNPLASIHKLYTCTSIRRQMTTSMQNINDKDGQFKRPDSSFRSTIAPNTQFPPEKGRYILYANLVCSCWSSLFFLSASPFPFHTIPHK
jgi:hypothetical protein